MNDMKDVVMAKIAQKLQKGMNNAITATTRLQEEGKISRDFLFDVGTERKGQQELIKFHPHDGMVGGTFRLPQEGPTPFRINRHAVGQLSAKLGIPGQYLTSLLFGEEWQRSLGYTILNTHNGWLDRSKMLVRTVGPEVRAFLSDSYRRLDSEMIFGTHIDEVFQNGGQLSDGYMDDTRIMVESMLPQPIEVSTEKNGVIYLAFGVRIDTSDYGVKALELRQFIMQGICLNGMVRQSVLRQIHLGARLPENMALSQKTYELDSMTTASAIRDLTKDLYGASAIKERMLEIKAATDQTIDPVKELTGLFRAGKLFKSEMESVGELLMRNDPMDGLQGDATLWKLTQGITRYANQEDVSAIRRMELQEIAGDLFNRIKTEE